MAQVDGQQRVLAVQVVQDRAALQVHIQVSVNRPVRVTFRQLVPDVTFVLRLLVDPRVLLVGQVLDWGQTKVARLNHNLPFFHLYVGLTDVAQNQHKKGVNQHSKPSREYNDKDRP